MDPTLLIIVAVLCLSIGYFANSLLSNRRSSQPPQADQAASQTPPEADAAKTTSGRASHVA